MTKKIPPTSSNLENRFDSPFQLSLTSHKFKFTLSSTTSSIAAITLMTAISGCLTLAFIDPSYRSSFFHLSEQVINLIGSRNQGDEPKSKKF